jgi:hypothetical protein
MGAPFDGRTDPIAIDLPHVASFTDGTQLTIATSEAIVEAGRVDLDALAAN